MPLNKFAAWGNVPAPERPGPGIGSIVDTGLLRLNATIKDRPVPTHPPTPSNTGLRVVWSLNAVRDALCDQREPSLAFTNRQIVARRETDAVGDIADMLEERYPKLFPLYLAQFDELNEEKGDYYAQRRERLAELAHFEWLAMATVQDPDDPGGPALADETTAN
jgi:hypothetical protein